MKRKIKRILILSTLVAALAAMAVWVIWANTALELNTITLTEDNLPNGFDGFQIAHVSDLHDAQIGENNADLIQMLKDAKPDIIAITGDIVDCRRTDISRSLEFAAQAVQIAPCYYVEGNHETSLQEGDFALLMNGLKKLGIQVLEEDQMLPLEKNGERIWLVGHTWSEEKYTGDFNHLTGYKVLLAHQPMDFSSYVEAGFDLVLSGHSHGGQIRLPLIGGLYTPDEGLLPEYDGGLFSRGNTDMVVSRGIGNSAFPLRFNNRPEVLLIVLQRG